MSIFDWFVLLVICPFTWLDFYLSYRQVIKLKKRVKELENENIIMARRLDMLSDICELNNLKTTYGDYYDEQ